MADIPHAAQDTIRHARLSRPDLPRPAIGATLYAMCRLIGEAFKMAYVEPYASGRRRGRMAADDDLDGRDPDW